MVLGARARWVAVFGMGGGGVLVRRPRGSSMEKFDCISEGLVVL